MYIQTEFTPNPDAIKFLPGREVSPQQNYFFSSNNASQDSPLAIKLFTIGNVESVFLGLDFITVTKSVNTEWDVLKPEIIMVIMEHLTADLPIISLVAAAEQQETAGDSSLTSIEKQIMELIDTRVRPSVAMDGGDIVYKGFKEGVVYLELHGACAGCPSSTITLKEGIESMLQYYVPEVQEVVAVDNE